MSCRSSDLVQAFAERKLILTEGAMVERLRRDPSLELHPMVANAALLYSPAGRLALSRLWCEYIEVAHRHDRKILLYIPTWRVNEERLSHTGLPDAQQIAADAFSFLHEIRSRYGAFANQIFIGGLVGCRGDAYAPQQALDAHTAEDFHQPHVTAIAQSGIDFLLATTLPALSEAIGLAKAMAHTSLPYGISFVVRSSGTLLDGTPLAEAMDAIEANVPRPPVGFFANCVHPANFLQALAATALTHPGAAVRILGIQGNASRKSPEELDQSLLLDVDDPTSFAQSMRTLYDRFGMSVLGGCCGTDRRHITAIAEHFLGL